MLVLQSLRYTWIFVCCFQCKHIYILIELWQIVLFIVFIWNNVVRIDFSLCSCRLMILDILRNLNLPVFKPYCGLLVLPGRGFLLILKASRTNWIQREWGLFHSGSLEASITWRYFICATSYMLREVVIIGFLSTRFLSLLWNRHQIKSEVELPQFD